MKSTTTRAFRERLRRLPEDVRSTARKNFRLWLGDPSHPSLRYRCVSPSGRLYSARVGEGWRALAYADGESAEWFWIGSHAEYDRLLRAR